MLQSILAFFHSDLGLGILGAILVIDNQLMNTDKVKANTTFQAIGNAVKWLIGLVKPAEPPKA